MGIKRDRRNNGNQIRERERERGKGITETQILEEITVIQIGIGEEE